ncbi:MAG: DUF6152 family protein [Acidobacteriota bacterium]
MKNNLIALALCLTAGLGTVSAHHSLAAEYDQKKSVTLTGTLTNIDWRNPHAFIFMDVKNAAGAVEKWQCELGSPNAMNRAGFTKKSAAIGEEITLDGLLAKDGSKTCSTRVVKSKDGRTLFSQADRPVQ